MSDSQAGDASNGTESTGGAEPGFGEVAGGESLPDMTDTLPSMEDSYGDANPPQGSSESGPDSGQNTGTGNSASAGTADSSGAGTDASTATGKGAPGQGYEPASPGTRASGGLEGIGGADGTLTTAEQVAILDRQLEQSTSDFDGMIREEQERQRELDRERAARSADREQPESAGAGTSGRNPYEDDVAMGGGGGASGGGGGIGGASGGGGAPENPAIYKPPADIPSGNDDDVVARQLREAAMREPDPEVRKKLWDEYRKYKGLEIPQE